ncbi:hypothetical protein A6723_020515 [Pseudomonas sp. AU11447]|uniref:hypothetical protein n=1 Tax=unclassified Pseudomonas TaxID=196821 RepID=UPI0006D409F4|nr:MULTISPECIES: hypothetical protein [unclassified Pseudomonas]OBY90997.1 hypothetical protein A6723_020515 [Pseudomonas sp. AU11447]
MPHRHATSIPDLLIANVPRDLVMGVEDAFDAGAMRAYLATKDLSKKHRKNALGQMRHFHMNELFSEALLAAGAEHAPLQGNGVVVGQAGMFKFSRVNMSSTVWNNAKRSSIRRKLSEANQAMTHLVQPSLFTPETITTGTFFFVACFSGSLHHQPEQPIQVFIAVPDAKMEGWLFREPLKQFLARYDEVPPQVDRVTPTLKSGALKTGQQAAS